MESSSSSGGAKQRTLAQENSSLNINDFLDDMTRKNTTKLLKSNVSMYNQTMESLNSKEGANSYKLLDETPLDELPQNISSLSSQRLKQLMSSDAMSRDNPRGLISLVHYILMTGFGCRARDECWAITNEDLVFGPESSIQGLPQYFTLSERITKTRRSSKNDRRNFVGRVYLDKDHPNLCPVRTLLHYQSKKTQQQLDDNYAFLLSVKQSAQKNPQMEVGWFTNHPMGVNYIGSLFKNAVEKAGVII